MILLLCRLLRFTILRAKQYKTDKVMSLVDWPMGCQHLTHSGRGNQFPVKPKISPDRCIVSHTDIHPDGIESFRVGTLLTAADTNSTNKGSAIHASTRNITTTNLAPYKPTMTSQKHLGVSPTYARTA